LQQNLLHFSDHSANNYEQRKNHKQKLNRRENKKNLTFSVRLNGRFSALMYSRRSSNFTRRMANAMLHAYRTPKKQFRSGRYIDTGEQRYYTYIVFFDVLSRDEAVADPTVITNATKEFSQVASVLLIYLSWTVRRSLAATIQTTKQPRNAVRPIDRVTAGTLSVDRNHESRAVTSQKMRNINKTKPMIAQIGLYKPSNHSTTHIVDLQHPTLWHYALTCITVRCPPYVLQLKDPFRLNLPGYGYFTDSNVFG
jgi:hypothetical protein